MTTPIEPPQPEQPEPVMTWAQVYSTDDCGKCGQPDCPACLQRLLTLLRQEGTNRTHQAKGLANGPP